MDHYFSPGGYRDFQEAGNFFCRRLSACNFFFSTHCADNFFSIPQISHSRGGLCRQFFSDAPLGQTIYFSNFSHADNFFPNHDTPQGKNNGPSLTDVLAQVLDFSGVNFCLGIRLQEVTFVTRKIFGDFLK